MKDNKNKLKMVLLIGAFFLCGVLYFSLNAGSKKEAVVTESFADQSGETRSEEQRVKKKHRIQKQKLWCIFTYVAK